MLVQGFLTLGVGLEMLSIKQPIQGRVFLLGCGNRAARGRFYSLPSLVTERLLITYIAASLVTMLLVLTPPRLALMGLLRR